MTAARKFMLDTDMVSYALRGQGFVGARLVEHAPSQLCMSSITLAELRFGADRRRSKRLHRLIDTFAVSVSVIPFDAAASALFGRLCARLESSSKPIGTLDTLIAAHAMAMNATLVTNNARHFGRVAGLKFVNWFSDAATPEPFASIVQA